MDCLTPGTADETEAVLFWWFVLNMYAAAAAAAAESGLDCLWWNYLM